MRNLARAVKSAGHAGEPVPLPFKSWKDVGMGFWRADLAMVAGPPGIGKSTLALTIAVRSGLPTLYLSADSSLSTQSTRILSMVSGVPLPQIKKRFIEEGEAFWSDPWVQDMMRSANHIRWNLDSQPTLSTLDEEVAIFETIYGEPPSLIVIDNASDVAFDSGDEFSSLRELMRQLKLTARETNASVIVLHHTSEKELGDPCPPLHAVHGKVNQVPSVVLTLGQPRPGWITVCPAKNREGMMDRHGHNAIWMQYHPDTMSIYDMEATR